VPGRPAVVQRHLQTPFLQDERRPGAERAGADNGDIRMAAG